MQTVLDVDESSGKAEQNLPILKPAADSTQPVERDQQSSVTEVDRIAALPDASAEAALIMVSHPVRHDFIAQAATTSADPAPSLALGRAIESAVVALQHASATSMAVVLKPDANTEISLHLKAQPGHFEALAVLERGDFKSLTAEWVQLQSRLADQGISLAPLVSSPSRAAGFAGGWSSSPEQQRDAPSSADIPGPRIASSTARKSGAPIVHATTGREWWA